MGDEEMDIQFVLKDEEAPPEEVDEAPAPSPRSTSHGGMGGKKPPGGKFSAALFADRSSGAYPFAAMVGQDILKRALLLNIVNPQVGGVLIRGEKGTGKSLAVRSLTDVLPIMHINSDCRFNCDPAKPKRFCRNCKDKEAQGILESEEQRMRVIYLPLNVTEDRLVGTIDIERVLSEGVKEFEPGILAQAHRNVLYIDEINLLEDNIVDLLLDAAAMGMVTVEREGISFSYSSEFVLVGSMNPQEGELRPQLLDRLALQAEVKSIDDVESRVLIIKRSRDYMEDPGGFRAKFKDETDAFHKVILEARNIFPEVSTPPRMLALISQICIDFNIDGHRGDIIIERTARTNAAFEGRTEVTADDVVSAAEMALPHRMRKQPFEEEEFNASLLHKMVREYEKEGVL
ncbi:MAG: ATP-binding protein [Candidatus Thermoplasmatota archaeon]|nr:ATP-binding protein [Candidatus Thermoplasmatota archaeon]